MLGSGVEIEASTIANQRPAYLVLLVTTRRPASDLVVKLAWPAAWRASAFDRTARLHEIARTRTMIPLPETIAVDVTLARWPWRFLIRTRMPGEEWATVRRSLDARQLAHAHREFGDAVGQLDTIQFPTFGQITAAGSVGAGLTWAMALAERPGRTIADPRLLDLFLIALARRADLLTGVSEASLCHDDLHQYNILFRQEGDRWQLATILDFDKAWAGHRETDLARLDLWTGMTSPAFWAGYQQHCPVDAAYHQRRALYQMLWCLEYAEPTAEHEADTRRVCAELGLTLPSDRPLFGLAGRLPNPGVPECLPVISDQEKLNVPCPGH